jgi:glycosyltransferase involved in cell wall biosynthesis/radical SAM superfamily enzyme YgiQ (UPF0313 family)/ADP-heptose:LPS heptosyltransferase/ubiquinone/menaquinone biosynthesis C-methylase UbiE
MRILLISLPGGHGTDEPIFPLGIGYLVAVLKKEHRVKVAHYQKFEHVGSTLPELINSFRPEVVGFTCTTFNRGNVRNIVSIIKKYCPTIKVVVGGVHASFLYEQVLNSYGADVVVIGEGEYTALELCRALENGTSLDDINGIAFKRAGSVILTPPRQPIENLDELPMPDYDFAEHLMRISGMGFVITSRGCPVRCIFCSTSSYWGQKVRKTSVTRVVDEMEYLIDRYKIRKIFFHDDTFNLGIERVKQICCEIMRRKINIEWAASCRVTPVSQEMVDIMVEAGCRHICWGVETGSETMLKSLEKKITLDQIRNAYELTKKHSRIVSSGAFAMVGSPGESEQTIRETVEFFNTIPLTDHPSTATLCLLPGTKIHFDMKCKGLVDDSIWLLSDEVSGTKEHSEETLQRWAQQVSGSGNILPFDKKKHFWNNVLFGDVPKAEVPRFLIDQSESPCKAVYNTNNTTQNSPGEKPLPHSYRPWGQVLPATGEFKRQSERCGQLPASSGVAGSLSASELDNIIPPEIKDDEFYRTILKLSREENIRTVLEIGSSAGEGSTEAFVSGLRENKNKPTLFCIEVSKPRFSKLQRRYEADSFVKCYYASSIPMNRFLSKDEVVRFYNTTRTMLANYPIDRVLGWLRQDIEYVESSGAPNNGIQIIKTDNGIINFDMVLIDGSAFTGGAELDEVYGAKIILLDDINDIKNYNNYKRLSDDPNYTILTQNWKLRNGYAIFKRNDLVVPIHFFTIVLNGEPFIRYHIDVFKKLPFKWHWHIMEGVADLKHDTAWSLKMGGRISNELHHNGRSNDGTTEYLDELAQRYPENITIYRKSEGVFWDGKLEMVNAPLANIKQECLLWQVDADELWTLEQICAARDMFIAEPDRTAAYYLNHFFVGENLVTTTIDTYGNNTGYEWLRTWRFKPGFRWTAHEPPRLCMPAGNGSWADIAAIKPFKHSRTSEKGLVFQHYAYATEKQLGFKEIYYGYKNAIAQWRRLQQQNDFPVFLRDYFAWVNDAAQVNTVKSQNITPIARRDDNNQWQFGSCHLPLPHCKKVLIVRPDAIGDFVIFSGVIEHFRKLYAGARIYAVVQEHVAELAQVCPHIDEIITFKKERVRNDHAYANQLAKQLQEHKFDVAVYPVYSRDEVGDFLTINSGAKEKIASAGDVRNISLEQKLVNNASYTKLIPAKDGIMLETLRNVEFLKGLGVRVDKPCQPRVWVTKQDEDYAKNLLSRLKIEQPIIVCPFAGFSTKHWPIEKWGTLLSSYWDIPVLICGDANNHDDAVQIINLAGNKNIYNLCGQTTVRQMATLLSMARLCVSVDSGPAHIVVAAGCPHVIVSGGGDFGRFMPYSPLASVVALPLECFGCNWNCRYEKVYCVAEILPEVVAEAIRQSLLKRSEKPRVFVQSNPAYKAGTGKPQLKSLEKVLDTDNFEVIEVGNLNKGERPLVQLSSMSLSKTDCRVFTYSKKSHFALFKGYDTELYAGAVDPDNCDLKNYQDLLVLLFIRENIPTGSRILDIGGGNSRILKHLKNEYECWNLDKLEGRGSGPASIDSTGYRLVKDYIGNFNKELPDNYFDFVFSISALEHVPDDNPDYLGNIRDDIERILKPGGYSLHCFDVVIKKDSVWTNKLLPFLCQNLKMITPFVPFEELERDPDLYVMTEKAYQKGWQSTTKKTYLDFGKPLSYNVLWQKMPSPLIKTSGIIGRFDKANVPKISVVTPSFNQAEYLEECIDSILGQNYPNLEYVIMDGGSTDGSVEIIKKYEKYLSYWQSRPDGGQYAAINEGFKRATGEIMTWLNSDDKYHTDSLFKAAHVFEKYPDIEWITGRPTAWNEKGELIRVFDKLPLWSREKYLNRAFKDCCIQQESTFWTRTLWDKAGGKLESHLQFAGDLELWVRFFRHARLFTVDALLGGYRYQRKQKTNLCMDKYIQEGNQIIDQELADIRKGKFTMMLPAPEPVSFNEMEFQQHKRKIVSADIPDGRREYGLQPQKGTALTVATSIAPSQLAKQVNAIESWIKLGFDVVSINGEEEIETLKGTFPNVRFIQAKRDARNILGRPFVYFDDILEYLRQTDSEICGIVNSDIYLSGDENVVSFIRSQAKNSLVYGARTEVDSLENLSGTAYQCGFDFFFFDKSMISHFPKSDFCIGAPWWDYWMPVILVLAGCPVKKLISPFAYHVRHPCKWDLKQWFLMGGKLYGYLREIICEKIASKSLTGRWDLLARMLSTYAHFFIKKIGSAQNKDEHTKILYQSGGPCILEFLGIESQPIDQTGRQRAKSPNADDYADSDITVAISFEDYQKAGELNRYGEYLLNKGDMEGAMNAFTEATRLLPDFTTAYSNIGVSYLRKNQPAAALKYFTKALKIDPMYLPCVINSAGVLIRCGKIQTARNLVLNSAQKLIDSGMPGKAAEIYRAYLWENPSDGEIIKALENLGILESAETHAQTKNIPIVFLHWGDSNCLKYALAQAHLSNPQSKIYLIGDQTNDKYDFVEHYNISDYCENTLQFEKAYKHLSTNPSRFERMCFLRWFVFRNFLRANNIGECICPDSDVMIYADFSEHWQRFENSGMTVSRGISPHFNRISDVKLLNEFCDFIVQGYTTNSVLLHEFEKTFADMQKQGLPGGICDMTFFGKFRQKYPDKILDISEIVDGSKFDNHINEAEGFETKNGRKKIYWQLGKPYGKKPYGKLISTGQLIAFNTLHLEGGAKIHAEDYFAGQLQLSLDGKKWGIKDKRTFTPSDSSSVASQNKYLVTAIVSTYNSEKYIRGCIEDLECQTIADKLEIIVVDSGSQENEAAIVKEFQQQYNNIKYIRTERETIYGAWNRAIKAASGKYLTNANTDDRHYKDSLEKLTEALEQNPWAVIAYGNQHITSTIDGVITGELGSELNHLKLLNGTCLESQPMWRRDLHDVVGYFDEQFFCSGDYEFWIRATQQFDMLHVDIFAGKRLLNEFVVSWANQFLLSVENCIIAQSYAYAMQTGEQIGKHGISGDARLANLLEIKVWKRRVAAKLACRQGQASDEIVGVKDIRTGGKPKLSVVAIETEATKWQCIQSLASQGDQDFELILIAYRNFPSQSDLAAFTGRICIVQLKDDIGAAFARNVGIAYAKGDLIVYLDSSMQANPGWVKAIFRQFTNSKVMAARGQIINNNNPPQAVVTESYATFCENADNCAFRKSVLLEAKGFDEDMLALEGQELSYRICEFSHNALDMFRFEPGMLVHLDVSISEPQKIIQKIRNSHMQQLLWRKHNDVVGYIEFYLSQDPSTSWQYDNDYVKVIAIAIFLQKGHPELAMKWAQKAVTLDPGRIKGRYLLGISYFEMGSYDKAAAMLEPAFLTQLQNLGNPDVSASEFERQTINVDCCLSAGTKLAQCYMKKGQYGKLRNVYTLLLNNPHLTMPPEQRASIQALLVKLRNVEDVPVQAAVPQADSPVHYPLKPEPCLKAADKKDEKYLVSAIVSTYNSETFIRGCLEDLENQTIADKLEIIVVNSGSEQNEESSVKEFQKKYDNIVYIKTEREGLYSAWNRAVKAAHGQFLTNANTDDRHSKDAYEIMVKTLIDNPDVALVYGNQIITDTPNPSFENHHVIEMAKRPEFSKERLLFGCCVGSQPMWRKSLHEEFGGFDETLTCAADWNFWLKIAGKYRFKHIDEFLGLYYRNENGIEHGTKIHSLYERYIVGKRYGNPYISVIPIYKNNRNPLVSIIMPAYNAGRFIAGAIETALIQNYHNFEIVVADDGSTDNTKEILQKFNDPRIRYIALEKNQGVSHARNVAIQQAKGEFIVSLDADDMLMPDFISRHLIELEKHPDADMIYCDDLLIDENDKPIREIKRRNYRNCKSLIGDLFRHGFPIVPCRHFVRKNVFDRIGLYDESLIIGEDYDLMRKFVKEDLKFYHLPENLCLRRIVDSSLSRKFSAEKAKSHFDVVKRYSDTFACEELFPDVDWNKIAPEKRKLQAKCLSAVTCFTIGQSYVKTAPVYAKTAFDQACSELDECSRMDPANPHVQQLLRKCEVVRSQCVQAVQEAVY